MKDGFLTQGTHGGMTMHNLYSLSNDDVAEEGEEREDGGESRGAVDDGKGDMEDLDAICQVSDALSIVIGVSDDDNLVSSVDELRCKLVDVTFDSSGLGVEEIADHGDIVRSLWHRSSFLGSDDRDNDRKMKILMYGLQLRVMDGK